MKGKYMPISYEWLQSFFEAPLPTPEELAKLITNGTFEIEEMLPEGADWALDVKVLPDRASDAFSHRGIAHEVSVLTGLPFKDPFAKVPSALMPRETSIQLLLDTPLCDSHALALVRGVRVGESPPWLKNRLATIGQRSINNVVDATNYVMFELGQPVHVFDWEKLSEHEGTRGIRVRKARVDEPISLLGGGEYTLSETAIVLADAVSDYALDIAGIKGGVRAELTHETTDILITVAHFDAVAIRKTSRALGVRTDASKRFENGIPRAFVPYAIERVLELIHESAQGTLVGFAGVGIDAPSLHTVSVSFERINALLGTDLSKEAMISLLIRQGFGVHETQGVLTVSVPFERNDIVIPEDIVEEVARVYGYNAIPDTPLPMHGRTSAHAERFIANEAVRGILGAQGFTEIMTYSLGAVGEVHLKNAFASDKSALRAQLKPSMREALQKNEYVSPLLGEHEAVLLFEIGSVFLKEAEEVHVCIGARVLSGKKRAERADAIVYDALCALGVEAPVDDGMSECVVPIRTCAHVLPSMAPVAYVPFSLFPFVSRDIAVWVPDNTQEKEVFDTIEDSAGTLLVRLDRFDMFSKEGKTSYAFHAVFQSMERTLTDEEVGKTMQTVENSLRAKGFEVR